MTPSDVGLLLFVIQALGQTATDMLADSAKEKIIGYLKRPERLKNDEVGQALRKAKLAALRTLRADYKKRNSHDVAGLTAFDALLKLPSESDSSPNDATLDQWLSGDYAHSIVPDLFTRFDQPIPPRLRRFLEERFPGTFVFAFREVGIKGNDRVRAVIFEALLHKIADSSDAIRTDLGRNDQVLLESLRELGHRLDESQTSLSSLLQELRHEIARVSVHANAHLLGDGRVSAFLRISDDEGYIIRTETVRRRQIVIGRGDRASLELDDRNISREHADLLFDDDGVTVVDRQSTHGTFVEGRKVVNEKLPYGAMVSIGRFRLEVLSPQTRLEERVTPATPLKR
jgi:hypothetical protein